MEKEIAFETNEVCEFFDLTRTTLFRWERDGLLRKVTKEKSGQRRYSQANLKPIVDHKTRKDYKRIDLKYRLSEKSKFLDESLPVMQNLSVRKILAGEIQTGIYELEQHKIPLTSANIKKLLKFALITLAPDEKIFWELIELIAGNNPFKPS